MSVLRLGACALLVSLAACAPRVLPILTPVRFDHSCLESKLVNLTGIESVLTSTDDRILPETKSPAQIRSLVRARTGAIAYWNDQVVKLPSTAKAVGETDGYVRVRALAVPAARTDESTRRVVYIDLRDGAAYRWVPMEAYDVQDVCVEGHRQS